MAVMVSPRQRPILIVNGRAIRYQELSATRPVVEKLRDYSNVVDRKEYESLPWIDYWVLDTSGNVHEFNTRVDRPQIGEFRRSGRQVMRLQADGYVRSPWARGRE